MVKEKRQRIDNMYCYSGRINENFSSMIILPRHFAPFFSAWNLYMFDRSLSGFPRVALEFFKWHPPLCPGKWRVASPLNRRATDPSARLTRKSTTDKHTSKDLTVTEVAPADRISWFVLQLEFSRQSQRCLPFICTRRPRTLFPASFNSLNSFDCILD